LPDGRLREAPTVEKATEALQHLLQVMRGESRGKGGGFKDPKFDHFRRHRLEGMRALLSLYTEPRSSTYGKWQASSLNAAISLHHGVYCARVLRTLVRQFIEDHTILPINSYGNWNETLLVDENLVNDINLFLQEIGENISAERVVKYLAQPEVMEMHGIDKSISVRTARRYLKTLGFRFAHPKKEQYADGHEREDVVYYREQRYIPRWKEIFDRIWKWSNDNLPEQGPLGGCRTIVWFHDETIFYAHDRRRKKWYHKDVAAKMYQKGDGHSLMIADFVSCNFGWLCTPDGRSVREVMFPGKAKDGYFTAENILQQANAAIDLVNEMWPEYKHIFIYDNATTHLKRPDGSLSARKMPKGPSENFGVTVNKRDDNGNLIYNTDGSLVKTKIQMTGAKFSDGTPQNLYYGPNEQLPGQFKGMVNILAERGIDARKKPYECKCFKCKPLAIDCCCRRILLYNLLDFDFVVLFLETNCRNRGVEVIFLPNFHCELNPIELLLWDFAKSSLISSTQIHQVQDLAHEKTYAVEENMW
ncbi:hypothetical protein K435DRAFT_685271, partial [Dendrothele bispora CBS 962.96]